MKAMEIRLESHEYEPDLLEVARAYYTDLPYHNFGHALYVVENGRQLVRYCEDNGLEPNEKVVFAAGLLHDAGFDVPVSDHGLRSKEEFSAQTAEMILGNHGYTDSEIEHVAACIRSTERGVMCESIEAKILRRADLSNLTGDLEILFEHSRDLWQESWVLEPEKTPITFDQFMKGVHQGLQPYLQEDVSFGDFDRDEQGVSSFIKATLVNIEKIGVLIHGQTMGIIPKSWEAITALPEATLNTIIARTRSRLDS